MPRQNGLSAKDFQLDQPEQGHRADPAGIGRGQLERGQGRCAKGQEQGRRRPAEHRGAPQPSLRASPALRQRRQRRGPRSARPAARPRRAGLRDLQVRLRSELPVRSEDDGAEAPEGRLQGHRRHGDRPRRPARCRPAAPQLRDPARRPRRPDHRPEADPRRLEAARDHRDLPGRRQEPVLGQPDGRPGALDVEGGPPAAGAERPGALDLCLREKRRRHRPDRPPRPRGDGVPGRQGLPPDDHLAEVRALLPDLLGQRLGPLLRLGRGYRRGQRHPDRQDTRARGRSPRR